MRQYVVDAFTNKVFSGNPAAVCIVSEFPDDSVMLAITRENRLSETCFAVPKSADGGLYELRWFTPTGEIDLCGHATLACAATILDFIEPDSRLVAFDTLSGRLRVRRSGARYEMDFPAYAAKQIDVTPEMETAIGAPVLEAWLDRDLMLVLEDEETVANLAPNQELLAQLPGLLQNVTAKSGRKGVDVVSRTFGPKTGIIEDPVCGSAHCMIAPYWAERLRKPELTCKQLSERGGTLWCVVKKDRVTLEGNAALYSVAEIRV